MTNHKCHFCNRWPEKLNSELSSGWWRSKMRGHEREHLWERSGIFIFVSDDHQGPSNLHQSEGWCSETMVERQFGWRPHYLYSAHSWSVSRFWDDEKCSRYWTEDCGSENRRWEKFRWSRPGILPDRILDEHEGFLSVLAWKQPACSYSRRHHGIKSRLRDEQPCFSLMNDYCWLVSHKSDVGSLIPISYRCWCSVWFTFVVSLAFPSDVRFIVTSQIPNCQQETRGLLYGLVKMEYTNTGFWKWFSNLLAKLYFSQHFGPEI